MTKLVSSYLMPELYENPLLTTLYWGIDPLLAPVAYSCVAAFFLGGHCACMIDIDWCRMCIPARHGVASARPCGVSVAS
jgi:hypothetical protein